jgi:hypothetical protein
VVACGGTPLTLRVGDTDMNGPMAKSTLADLLESRMPPGKLLPMPDSTIREPDEIRRACARKLRAVRVSEHFGCLLNADWTTPKLVEMLITPDGHLLGRCRGEISLTAFLGAAEDLLRNIHGVATVAKHDGDEVGHLLGKVAEIKRQK